MRNITFTTIDPAIRERTHALLAHLIRASISPERWKQIQELLEQGVDLHARHNGHTAFAWVLGNATGEKESVPFLMEAVSLMIDAGANVNAGIHSPDTALNSYVRCHPGAELLDVLLAAGADIGPNPATLISAVRADRIETARKLLAAGAPVLQQQGNFNWTALDDSKSPKMDKVLDSHRADWELRLSQFAAGTYTPGTREDWNHLASVMPLEDPQNPPSAADRRKMLEEIRPELSLGGMRERALGVHEKAAEL